MARRAPTSIAPNTPRDTPITIGSGTVELRDEPDGSTTVWVNNVPSSSMRPELNILDFEYMRHMAAAVDAWDPQGRWLALHVGAAACSLPRYLANAYPESGHIAVDIDTTLPELVREWWDLPRAPRLRIRAQDGLDALTGRRDDSLDLVIRDAFAGDATPPHLSDGAWWQQARRTVRATGLVLANVGTRPGTVLGRDDAKAARTNFDQVVAVAEHAVLKGKRRGNVVLVAGTSVVIDALRRYAASAPLPTGVSLTWNV